MARFKSAGGGEVLSYDPVSLTCPRKRVNSTQPGHFSWDYLEKGPEAWRVRIARIA